MATATAPETPLQKVTEVARQLSVSRAFVYQLMDRGELPYLQLGGTRRVRAQDVQGASGEFRPRAKLAPTKKPFTAGEGVNR